MGSVRSRTVAITGASSGVGRAAALRFARAGANLALGARSEEALEDVAAECRAIGAAVVSRATDVTDEAAVEGLADEAAGAFGRLDAWVNNASIMLLGGFLECPSHVYRRVIETNLLGYVHGARASLRHFVRQGHGTLVNTSSLFGRMGAPEMSAYVASKFGVEGLFESLRHELARHPHIHVCTVLLGGVDTPLFDHAGNHSGRAVDPAYPLLHPFEAADAIVRCVARPRRQIRVGKAARVQKLIHAVAPRLYERLGGGFGEGIEFADRPAPRDDGNAFSPTPPHAVRGGWRERRTRSPLGVARQVLSPGDRR